MPRGATCSLTSKAITIVGGSTPPSATSPRSRQTGNPHNPVSTFPGEGHPRQLARIVRARQLMGEVGAAERDGEEEAQRRGLRIHLRWLRTLLDLRKLEAADVVAARGIG